MPDVLEDLSRLLTSLGPDSPSRMLEGIRKDVLPGLGMLGRAGPMEAPDSGMIRELEAGGNICRDWTQVRIQKGADLSRIRNNHFLGFVRIGDTRGPDLSLPMGGSLETGIYHSTLRDCETGPACAIHRCPLISRSVICSGSLAMDATITCREGLHAFGNGLSIRIGVETGGREIRTFLDMSLELAEFLLRHPGNPELRSRMDSWLDSWLSRAERSGTVIQEGSCIVSSRVEDSWAGPRTLIQGAVLVQDSTLAGTVSDPVHVGPGCILRHAVLQEGVEVQDNALVDSSMLFEHSEVTQHGKAVESIVGPNSGVSKGETTCSFLGPFVGFHHQSLLISAFWPRGRGNIAYGANVGSNHTSRMPDQEFWPGEGMFFGLGCSVKYPSNFSRAPYTIIAAGVSTLPQRMSYPFSLINEPVGYFLEVPPGLNNLIPAWGLSENLYSLYRNEGKYKARNKARRNVFDLDLFRPEILACMEEAVQMLSSITERRTIYLPGDIPGIGKNMLTDENRLKAIKAYRFFLELSSLRRDAADLIARRREGRSARNVPDALVRMERLREMLPEIPRGVETSRTRDFDRGRAIIDDYHLTHLPVDQDPFVLSIRTSICEEDSVLSDLCAFLQESGA